MLARHCGLIVISPGRRLVEYFDSRGGNVARQRAKEYGFATLQVRIYLGQAD